MLISTALLHALQSLAAASPTHEICGLLLGDGERIAAFREAPNVSPTPQVAFEIDPAMLLRAHRERRGGAGMPLIGYYHSHPSGSAVPSVRDAAQAAPDDSLWLILAGDARLWRAVAEGRVHGRFEPVGLRKVNAG